MGANRGEIIRAVKNKRVKKRKQPFFPHRISHKEAFIRGTGGMELGDGGVVVLGDKVENK